jgi:hypothetical protein
VDLVYERLSSWPGVFRDDSGRVVGFWRHAIERLDPDDRLIADRRTTYAVELATIGLGEGRERRVISRSDTGHQGRGLPYLWCGCSSHQSSSGFARP